MKPIEDATMQESLEHYNRHLRSRIAISAKMSAALTEGSPLRYTEDLRRATLQGVVGHLSDILSQDAPRYTTETHIDP